MPTARLINPNRLMTGGVLWDRSEKPREVNEHQARTLAADPRFEVLGLDFAQLAPVEVPEAAPASVSDVVAPVAEPAPMETSAPAPTPVPTDEAAPKETGIRIVKRARKTPLAAPAEQDSDADEGLEV